eukprot:17999-Heterococcus_DN1.PRE.1
MKNNTTCSCYTSLACFVRVDTAVEQALPVKHMTVSLCQLKFLTLGLWSLRATCVRASTGASGFVYDISFQGLHWSAQSLCTSDNLAHETQSSTSVLPTEETLSPYCSAVAYQRESRLCCVPADC